MEDKVLLAALNRIVSNTGDRVALLQEELTLTTGAQALPFTGIKATDVYAVEIRVKPFGSPASSGYIATFTIVDGDTPTATHGQYLGANDIYEITNRANIQKFKIIATESLAHVAHIIYFGA